MRATMKITWLLLSLSFLFHSIYSNESTSVTKDAASATSTAIVVPTNGTASGTEPSTNGSVPTAVVTSGTPSTVGAVNKNESTQKATPTKPVDTITTPAAAASTASQPTDKTVSTQPQNPTVINNPVAPNTPATTAVYGITAAATPSQPNTTIPNATAGNNSGLVVAINATTATGAAPTLQGTTVDVQTTNTPQALTDALTTEKQSLTHATISSKTSQENSTGGTRLIATTVKSHGQATSRAPELTGNTGSSSTPSPVNKAGLPTAETLVTKGATTSLQTTPAPAATATTAATAAATTSTTTAATTATAIIAVKSKLFSYSLNNGQEKEEEQELVEVCRRLMANMEDGNCTLIWQHHNGKMLFDYVAVNGKVKTSLATQYYEEITKKPTDNKTLIAILASCGALLIMIVILAACASHHRKPYNENQQHLTEELHTVENGYHDNPTLEVMEVQPEMQEKKMALNGEFNDSWIVPFDNLLKEDMPDEEDTHL